MHGLRRVPDAVLIFEWALELGSFTHSPHGNEKKANKSVFTTEEFCSLCNIDHTLQDTERNVVIGSSSWYLNVQEKTLIPDFPPREMIRGKDFMMKQELIDAAEASGLSQNAIGPNNGRGNPRGSHKDFYSGWSGMKTLFSHALVVKWSNPAKYKLTKEGQDTACDCLARSGLNDPAGPMSASRSEEIVLSDSDSDESYKGGGPLIGNGSTSNFGAPNSSVSISPLSVQGMAQQQSFSTKVSAELNMVDSNAVHMENSILAMPPRQSNEKFLEVYKMVLILDDRETFGPRSRRKVADNICLQFHIPVEMKRLPVGDGIWIARHKRLKTEYVLDFIVERKNVGDLGSSIKDNRYKDQKLRLKKSGLSKVIYLVEGDPNSLDASESIKTACFTTEILEGFDVQRTTGYADTERTYGHLTQSITDYYSTNFSVGANTSRLCLTYDEFEKKCSDLKKITVTDVFALQLMQVPQVTEEAALAVIGLYPTVFSLARAYSMLDGDTSAQEKMLNNKTKMVNAGASRNIFKLVWAEE